MAHESEIIIKPKILCIDDEELILKSLQRILKKDYEVITASDGVDGIKLYDSCQELSIVTTDMNLPGINGLEVLTHIANKYRGVSTILIASCQPQEVEKANSLGANYISKPFNPIEVLNAAKQAYDKHLKTKRIIKDFKYTEPVY